MAGGKLGHLAGETIHRALGAFPRDSRGVRADVNEEFRQAVADMVRDAVLTGVPGVTTAVREALEEGVRLHAMRKRNGKP